MKTTIYLSGILFSLLFFGQGCSVNRVYYHSEAELPYYSRTTFTELQLISDPDVETDFPFGVIKATDNSNINYILLVLSNAQSFNPELMDLNFNHTVTLLPKQTQELINFLNNCSQNWSETYRIDVGVAYEYRVAPEQKIVQQSENVANWYPYLNIYYKNNRKGPLITMFLGEGLLQQTYHFNSITAINDFIKLLELARK